MRLIAYRTHGCAAMQIVPAPLARTWMDEASGGFAYRCLPMLIANQAGWHILSSHRLRVVWNGDNDPAGTTVEYLQGWAPYPACSHFGSGIVTWTVPYLFRTPPGYNLIVRGPANSPKDGCYPLEGIVETDWAVATFTVNWKLTRPGLPVLVEEGEPICMIAPQRRGEMEAFYPEIRALGDDVELAHENECWTESRRRFIYGPRTDGLAETWQKHYFQGATPLGSRSKDHQTRLHLREFAQANK